MSYQFYPDISTSEGDEYELVYEYEEVEVPENYVLQPTEICGGSSYISGGRKVKRVKRRKGGAIKKRKPRKSRARRH